jgi:hypothetical protein
MMAPLALTSDEQTIWMVVLGIGLVVVVVVIALLTLLLRIVIDIDDGVKGVWRSATRVAANTATTWQLRDTAAALRAVKAEALRHDAMLEERL